MPRESFTLTNRLPYMALRSLESDPDAYNSIHEATRPQIGTANNRGTMYVKHASIKSIDGLYLYTIVLEAQTLDYLNDRILERGRLYNFEWGWTDVMENRAFSTIEVQDVAINLVLEWGGVEITLKAVDTGSPFKNSAQSVRCDNPIFIEKLNKKRDSVTVKDIFLIIRDLLSPELDGYTFDSNGLNPTLSHEDISLFSPHRQLYVLAGLYKILNAYGYSPVWRRETDKENKGIFGVYVSYAAGKNANREYVWGSAYSELENLSISTVPLPVTKTDKFVNSNKEPVVEVKDSVDNSPNTTSEEAVSLKVGDNDEIVPIVNRFIPDPLIADLRIIGDPGIQFFDIIKLSNLGALGGDFRVFEITHMISEEGFFTALKAVQPLRPYEREV